MDWLEVVVLERYVLRKRCKCIKTDIGDLPLVDSTVHLLSSALL